MQNSCLEAPISFRIMKAFFSLLIIIAFLLAQPNRADSESLNADRIVAIVNDMIITQSELEEFINFSYIQLASRFKDRELQDEFSRLAQEALIRLVEDKLILQQANIEQIVIEDAVIEARLKEIKSKFDIEEDFEDELRQQNMSLNDIKKSLREQELMRAIVERKIRDKIYVAPAEITLFFNQHPEEFTKPVGREASFVSFINRKEAEAALTQIKEGKNFSKFASNNEDYQALKEIRKGTLPVEVEKEIFRLSPGEISEVVEMNKRFYIFKILKFLPLQKLSLLQAQDLIYTIVFNQKFTQAITDWLDKLKNEAYIVIK